MEITIENVVEAADLLSKRGEKPTLFLVRKAAGGGSYSTINEGLGVWRQRRWTGQLGQLEPVPQGMITDTQWTEIREEIEAEAKEATRIADDLADELEATRAEITEAQGRLKGLEVQVEGASQAISRLEKELLAKQAAAAKAQFDYDKLQAAAAECSGLLEALKHRLNEIESDLALERERRAKAEWDRSLLMSEQCCLF
ncbi:MAG: DNA-binding protein [Pseudomonadota bacterium]